MHISRRSQVIALLALVAGVTFAGPALAVEDGLMGVRIGASYRELTKRLGAPNGILLSAGGGMMYQTLTRPAAGLPQFGGQAAAPTDMPVWVRPVLVGSLAAGQAQWFYDLPREEGRGAGDRSERRGRGCSSDERRRGRLHPVSQRKAGACSHGTRDRASEQFR